MNVPLRLVGKGRSNMSKEEKGTKSTQDWVEVVDEPSHGTIFENEQIRAYIAVIRPGEETLYHRHDKDTLYVVLEGGKNYSTTLTGTRNVKYVLPKSISLGQKVKWLSTRAIYGWTDLPKSVYVLMHNEGNPVIHKVRGAEDNPADMRMMGIEFLNPGARHGCGSAGTHSLKVDYEDNTVRVFRLKFPSDFHHMKEALCFMGIVIVLKGDIRIEASSPDDAEPVPHDLNEGDLVWNDGGTKFTFAIPVRTEAEALVVVMK
jgi:hypothetical protein